ncbi:alkaline phosphatase [Moniliophthora roreri MCA 2997]|uniref:Alkaline phosphatase n=1 Tax=Moniliophthora roreri (strain MCA 2997) TaxID=1381753 RepID=V2YMY2_MONRO|nr:alkaline phosphatase [Moniliophthora roreri MCA 2997]
MLMNMKTTLLLVLLCVTVNATRLLDRNLVYRSPFLDDLKGDPFDTSVLLWTRAVPVSPDGTNELPDQSVPACLSFKISSNSDLSGTPLDAGEVFTSYDVDWTAKVEASGLAPDTKYFFQFSDCTNPSIVSPIGATRTLPSPDTPADEVNGGKGLTLAVFSCSQYQAGYFNAYGFAAHNTTADIFVHLGDYIYESLGNGARIGRQTLGRELATIHDYRQRLNQYRTDTSLAFAHQNAPWVTDDHEVADNAWKAGTADSNDTAVGCSFSPSGACFTDRKLAAVRAYHEWMPIRQVAADDQFRIWRNFQVGQLMDLSMLDTRQYDRDLTDVYYNTVVNTISSFPNRSLMGAAQESWLYDTLSESKERGAVWRVIGQQIVFTQLNESDSFDLDAWDGYRANRQRVLDHLYNNEIDNTVILAGDSHANWVSDLAHPNDSTTYDPITGEGAIGVEFAGTAVTSSGFGTSLTPEASDALSRILVATESNLNLQWSEGHFRGFFTLEVKPQTVNATYYAMRNTSNPNLDGFSTANFIVEAGANKLSRPVGGGVGNIKAGALKINGTN